MAHKDCSSAHLVQLFDAPRSLADAVSHFLIDGRERGDQLLVMARASHWQLIRAYLERRGVAVDDPSERLTVIDARQMRARMLRRGVPDPTRMHETVGELVAQLAEQPRVSADAAQPRRPGGLRVYGEIVELFAEEGNFEQAIVLEEFWNYLIEKHRFTLLCGYSAAHFADSSHMVDLQRICACHTRVRTQPSDTLGTWLTSAHQGSSIP